MSKFKISIISFITGAIICGFVVYKLTPKPKTPELKPDVKPPVSEIIRVPADYAGYVAAFNTPIGVERWLEGNILHIDASDTFKHTKTVDELVFPKYFPRYLVQGELYAVYFDKKIATMYGLTVSKFFYDGRFVLGAGALYAPGYYGLKASAGIAIY
jgi:hypothetical protein